MTTVAIHQPQYLPYLGFFQKLSQCDIFVAMDNVQFQRRGVQNRNKIKTQRGEQWLTVPVRHKTRDQELINEMQINHEQPWAQKQLGSIVTNYGKAPFFQSYIAEIEHLFAQTWNNLCDLDMALVQWMMEKLDLKVPIVYLSNLEVEGQKSELLINICRAVDAHTYLSGTGGKRYMELAEFKDADIQVRWQDFCFPTYDQLFPELGFIPNLSILDTLLCCGPVLTKTFLKSE
jgi:hypothetical protein